MKRIILLGIGMVLCLGNLYAQNEETVDPQKQEKAIQSLTEELEDRNKTIEKLNLLLEKLETENEQLDSALQAERKEGKATIYKKQIKQLQKDSLALSQQMETALEKMRQEHQQQTDAFIGRHREDSLTIVSLQEELNGLKEFRVKWLAQLAVSVDEKWLNKPYAAIDVTALERDYAQYEQYAPMDAKVAEAKNKLTSFVANARLYQQGKNAINSEYHAAEVTSLVEPMRTLRDNMPEGSNREDVANLCWQLDNYAITIEIFQDVIKAVNEAVNGQSPAGAWPLAKATLDKQEKESEYISAIKMIPWLAVQYDKYYELLKKDATKPNEVGETILNIALPQ